MVLEQDRKGVGVAAPRRVADEVDGVAPAPGRRQHRVEAGQRLRRQLGEAAALVDEGVGREDAEPAAVGHDRKAVAGHRRAPRQDLDGVEQLLQRPHAEHAGAPEGGLVDGVGAGERPGVGGGRPRALLVAPGLEDDHRLEAGRRSRRRHELAGVGHRLDVQEDGRGRGVQGQVVEQVAEVDVGHVADRDQVGEADVAGGGPVEDAREDGAGLGDEGELAGLGAEVGEGGVEAAARHHDAKAVRADDAQQVRPRRVEHRLAQGLAAGDGALAEAGGDDHRRLGAAGPERGDEPRHGVGLAWR